MIYAAAITFFLGACFRGFSELMGFHHDESIFSGRVKPTSFFGSKKDLRKYKLNKLTGLPENAPGTWYYRRFDLKYKERFPGSATIGVFLTCAFHLSNFLFRSCMVISVSLAAFIGLEYSIKNLAIALASAALSYAIGFHAVYYPLKK